jgi:hypothetical protein
LRLPRPCLERFGLPHVRGELIPSQPLAYDQAHHDIEAVAVRHLGIVVTERLFIELAEKMEGFD